MTGCGIASSPPRSLLPVAAFSPFACFFLAIYSNHFQNPQLTPHVFSSISHAALSIRCPAPVAYPRSSAQPSIPIHCLFSFTQPYSCPHILTPQFKTCDYTPFQLFAASLPRPQTPLLLISPFTHTAPYSSSSSLFFTATWLSPSSVPLLSPPPA